MAATIEPPTMQTTEYITGGGASFPKTNISPIIVNRILNLRSAVNIGRFKAWVDPSPDKTFPRNMNVIGST